MQQVEPLLLCAVDWRRRARGGLRAVRLCALRDALHQRATGGGRRRAARRRRRRHGRRTRRRPAQFAGGCGRVGR